MPRSHLLVKLQPVLHEGRIASALSATEGHWAPERVTATWELPSSSSEALL